MRARKTVIQQAHNLTILGSTPRLRNQPTLTGYRDQPECDENSLQIL